jgi:thiol-disulfide isomerase/thioredoxin
MMLARRRALILGAVGVAAAAAGAGVGFGLVQRDSANAALQAAEFTDLQGRTHHLAEWKGKILVCNFWATWCEPCRNEIPMLVALSGEMAPKNVVFVGIAVDHAAKVREFAKDYKITYPMLVAGPGGIELMRAIGNQSGGLPYTAFLDREGRVVGRKLGALNKADLQERLGEMLQR